MQSVSSRIWTRVAMSISYGNNHYTTGTSKIICIKLSTWNHITVQQIITEKKMELNIENVVIIIVKHLKWTNFSIE